MKVDNVQITRETEGWEISVLLSTDETEGAYTFMLTDAEWHQAILRHGEVDIDSPLPVITATQKEAVPA